MILFYSLDYIVFVVQGVANDYIKTIICKKTQYTTVNNTDVNPYRIFHGAPQASVLETSLFLILVNAFGNSVKCSTVYFFVDNKTLLYTNKLLKKINKRVNHDLALFVKWLRARKLSIHTSKTEIILCYPRRRNVSMHLNFL